MFPTISRRVLLAAVLVPAVWVSTRAVLAERKPNMVFIMADDLGYGHLGSYGQKKILTPHIDRLAREGIRFTRAYSGSHVCAPSRSVLLTGLHTGHTPIRANGVGKFYSDADVTVAEVLRRAGYATGAFGKWGGGVEGTAGHPNRQGFDEFFGQLHQVHAHFYYPYWIWENDQKRFLPGNEGGKRGIYIHDLIHEKALGFIRRNQGRPFFAYLPYIIPHVELVVPEDSEVPYRGKFPKVKIADPRAGYIGSDDAFVTVAGMISRLDRHVGEILALLEELSLDRDTIVFFTSDNGAQGGAWRPMSDFFDAGAGLRGYKGSFWEGGIRVPMIARWPGKIAQGRETGHLCAFQDVLPTLAAVAGVDEVHDCDGISFLPTLLGRGEQKRHRFLYWEYGRGKRLTQAVCGERLKAIRLRPDAPWQVFDLSDDPGEKNDIFGEQKAFVTQVERFVRDARTPPRDFPAGVKRSGRKDYVR